MTALRVLLVGPLPPPAGGMANQTRQLAQLLSAEGLAVTLVQTNAPYRPAWTGRVPVLRALFRLVPYLMRLWRATAEVDVVHVMANSGWAWHLFAMPAIRIAKARHRAVVVNYRGGLAAEFLAQSARSVGATLSGTCLAVPSAFLQQVFRRRGIESVIIPNVVDVDRFRPGTGLQRTAPAAPHVVGFPACARPSPAVARSVTAWGPWPASWASRTVSASRDAWTYPKWSGCTSRRTSC